MAVTENDLLIGPVTPTNGVTVISFDFLVTDQTWLEVYRSDNPDVPLVLTTDYTVTGVGDPSGGNITLVTPANGTDSYTIYLILPLERTSDLQVRGQFASKPFNDELDRVWQAMQGIKTLIERSVQMTRTAFTFNRLDFGNSAARASKFWRFDAAGDEVELVTVATLGAVTLPSPVVDGELIRADGTGGLNYQGSDVTINDDGEMTFPDTATAVVLQLGADDISRSIQISGDRASFGYNGADLVFTGGTNKGILFEVNGGTDGLFIEDDGNIVLGGSANPDRAVRIAGTDAINIPVGTTAQRPATPEEGDVRRNTTTSQWEGHDGSDWGSLGGAGLFKGENGESGDSVNGAGDIFRVHEQTLNTNTTIDADENALAAGPLEVANGVTLTVTSGGNLSIV